MNYKTRKVLITVKAYPNPSKKYVETVCVAGIDWRYRYKNEELLLNKIKERWLSMTSEKKDTYFYVGNMKRFPENFMVLGTKAGIPGF